MIARFLLKDGRLDPDSEEAILTVDQPRDYHFGGHVAFGRDGYLYVGFGDGGSGVNAPRLDRLLGKVVRLDLRAVPYAIPSDNPYARGGGRPEIWAVGFRNPWRFSFDPATNELWLGDVGQALWEEIDRVEGGANSGWPVLEASACQKRPNCDTTGLAPPIYAYAHDQGQAVTGGFVYRGARIPALQGSYIFGDFISGRIWSFDPEASPDPVLPLKASALRCRREGERRRMDRRLRDEEDLVHVAIGPLVAGLVRLHQRMPGLEEVAGGVAAGRAVAAPHVAAAEADAQVVPGLACFEAFGAARAAGLHLAHLGEVRADGLHGDSPGMALAGKIGDIAAARQSTRAFTAALHAAQPRYSTRTLYSSFQRLPVT